MSRICLDIETVPNGECPPIPEDVLNAVGNATKPETVERKREENRKAWPAKWAKEASLDWRQGKIVAIGYKVDDGFAQVLRGDTTTEIEMLEGLWDCLKGDAPIVGFGVRRFDWPYLLGRSAVLGVLPSRRITESPYMRNQMIDWADILSNHNTFKVQGWTLGAYCELFGLPKPTGKGEDVYGHYLAGEWDAIIDHCWSDVLAVAAIDEKCREVFL